MWIQLQGSIQVDAMPYIFEQVAKSSMLSNMAHVPNNMTHGAGAVALECLKNFQK